MSGSNFPKSVTKAQIDEALALLGIFTCGKRVVSIDIGIHTITITTNAEDADGNVFLDDTGKDVAKQTHRVAIHHGAPVA